MAYIRIEALPTGPQGEAPSEKPADKTAGHGKTHAGKAGQNDKLRHERRQKHHGEASGDGVPKSETMPGLDKEQRHEHKPADAERPRRDHAPPFAKPAFGKKPKKNKHRG